MRVKNSCIVNTTYSLALYILYMPMNEILATRFFVGPAISSEIASHLPFVFRFDTKDDFGTFRFWGLIRYRLKTLFVHFAYVLGTRVYGLDHLPFFEMVLGFEKYTLLEDAPGIFTRCLMVRAVCPRSTRMTMFEYVRHVVRFGLLTARTFGTNGQCVNRILTDPNDVKSRILYGRPYELVDLQNLWNAASEEKKCFVRDLFGINSGVMASVANCSSLFFTQPYRDDLRLTDDEWISVLDPVLRRGGVAIKIHPRDTFDYAKYYPDVPVLKCSAPMQLLSLDVLPFKRAITINSTAVSAMPGNVEKVILGTSVHPKIQAAMQNVP